VIFPAEVEVIKTHTGLGADSFSEPCGKGSVNWILSNEGGCYFCRDGKCDIYPVRPLDCRLFPWDIAEEDGRLVLIVHDTICPVKFRPEQYIGQIGNLIREFGEQLLTYARVSTPGMYRENTLGYVDEILGNEIYEGWQKLVAGPMCQ
jgi:hypothetical protein